MKPLKVARARLKRAIAHLEQSAKLWNALEPEDLYSAVVEVHSSGTGRIRIARKNPLPEEHSLLLGEALYQLRSALDACIYQASIYATGKNPPPDEKKLEFPICTDAATFPELAKRRLFALPQQIQDAIEKMQPYNTPSLPDDQMVKNVNRSLGILNDLARKDRHRTVHVIGSWVADLQPEFRLPKGVRVSFLRREIGGFLEDWNDLATFKLEGFRPGMSVQANPFLTTSMALNEPPPPCHENDTWSQRLTEMLNTVDFVITQLEGYF